MSMSSSRTIQNALQPAKKCASNVPLVSRGLHGRVAGVARCVSSSSSSTDHSNAGPQHDEQRRLSPEDQFKNAQIRSAVNTLQKILREDISDNTGGKRAAKTETYLLSLLPPEFVRKIGLTWAAKELETEFNKADANKDGTLSLAEFQDWAKKIIEKDEERLPPTRRQLFYVFLRQTPACFLFGFFREGN